MVVVLYSPDLEYFGGFGTLMNSLSQQIHLTFRGPCILIYSYNKTNKMH